MELILELARQARRAESASSLQFLLVNQTHALVPYLTGLLWIEDEGVILQSGVSHVERHSPFTLWVNEICSSLANQEDSCVVHADMFSEEQLIHWGESLPENALWLPVHGYKSRAGFLVARTNIFTDKDLSLLDEWVDIWSHAWIKVAAPSVQGELKNVWNKLNEYLPSKEQLKNNSKDIWRGGLYVVQLIRNKPTIVYHWICAIFKIIRLKIQFASRWIKRNGFEESYLALINEIKAIWSNKKRRWKWIFWIVVFFPVRLTVLAPGELVPENPVIIRVPIEGVIDEFYVAPNDRIVSGQPLFSLDLTSILSKLQIAQQEIQVATQEYRQSALQSLTDSKSRGQLAAQEGKAAERKIEAEYLQSILDKAKIKAPRDGIVIFDDPTEWIGKPVVAGEKVMIVAKDGEVEIEAWIPIGDVLEVSKGASVTLYLNASPFSSVTGALRYIGHEPMQRPDGSYAYRVRASVKSETKSSRIGWKGTAKVSGQFVPLSYWVLRKPLASLRQFIGI
jgi:hypothetical protein